MEIFKIKSIDSNTFLLLPIDAEIPLSFIIESFNKNNTIASGKIIIDLLVYVGSRDRRFKICELNNGKIKLSTSETFYPKNEIVEMSYDLFSDVSEGLIEKIIIPSIRKKILNQKNKKIMKS